MTALCVSLADFLLNEDFCFCCARTLSDHDSKVEVHQSYKNSWDFLTARNVSWEQIRKILKFRESFTSSNVYTIQQQVFWTDKKNCLTKRFKTGFCFKIWVWVNASMLKVISFAWKGSFKFPRRTNLVVPWERCELDGKLENLFFSL